MVSERLKKPSEQDEWRNGSREPSIPLCLTIVMEFVVFDNYFLLFKLLTSKPAEKHSSASSIMFGITISTESSEHSFLDLCHPKSRVHDSLTRKILLLLRILRFGLAKPSSLPPQDRLQPHEPAVIPPA
jgi:hypothetical protein